MWEEAVVKDAWRDLCRRVGIGGYEISRLAHAVAIGGVQGVQFSMVNVE
jgi:hypothetical protein